ncbi:MAG TPA: response regulator transcription factor [Anaerolineae bacterium]|nr:response regulator transcription factor [Anaerolineae bacterium]
MLTVVLADDHAVMRDGLRLTLEEHRDIHVLGEAANGYEAIHQAHELRPDVIVLDIAMPQLNGIDAIPQLRLAAPEMQIVILSMHSNPEYALRALEAGALGYVLKESAAREVVDAIRTVNEKRRYLSPQVADALITHTIQTRQLNNPLDSLSQREREILQLVAEGKSTQEIAELLSLSPKSVETYRSRMMSKLNIHDLATLIRFAIKHGITPL